MSKLQYTLDSRGKNFPNIIDIDIIQHNTTCGHVVFFPQVSQHVFIWLFFVCSQTVKCFTERALSRLQQLRLIYLLFPNDS